MIRDAFDNDTVKFFIVYGPHGYGKSAYMARCLAQLYQTWEWEKLKKFLVWKTKKMPEIIESVISSGHDELMLGCDDAGVWLNAMRWNSPLLAALTEYFDVIRMHFHGVMFTTPLPMHVIKRLRGLPQCITIRIDTAKANEWKTVRKDPYMEERKPRKAIGYSQMILPDMKKVRVQTLFWDFFNAVLPEKFYKGYLIERKGYTKDAWENVKAVMEKESKQIETPLAA